MNTIRKLFSKTEQDNYKLFFPLAVPGFFSGIGLWVVSENYTFSQIWHPLIMLHLFLFPVILGFLWTGIPRFLASEFPGGVWKFTYLLLVGLSYAAFAMNDPQLFRFSVFVSYAGLFIWLIQLIRKSKAAPVLIIPFLFYSLLSALLGSAILFASGMYELSYLWIKTANELYRFLFFSFLIGAVGSRLIPVLSLSQPPAKGSFTVWSIKSSGKSIFWWIAGGFIFASVLVASAIGEEFLVSVKLFVLIFFAKEIWLLFEPYKNKIMTVWYLRIAVYAVVISPLFYLIPKIFPPAAAHFQFLSMFVMLIFIVSARVILGHGGHDVEEKERYSVPLAVSYFLILIVLVVRPFTVYLPDRIFTHSMLALTLMASAILFLLEMFRAVTEKK